MLRANVCSVESSAIILECVLNMTNRAHFLIYSDVDDLLFQWDRMKPADWKSFGELYFFMLFSCLFGCANKIQ